MNKGEFLGNKIADAVTKSNDGKIVNQELVEEIIIPPEERDEILTKLRQVLLKVEHYKLSKLLNYSTVSKFVAQKWVGVNDLSSGKYSVNKDILLTMPRSDLCDYSNAYIVVKERISVTGNNVANRRNKKQTFKNNIPFKQPISKINNTSIDNAEDLDILMPIYNLLEYSNNYSMTSGSLWNYSRDEVNDSANENNDANNFRINNNKTTTSKSFEHKTKVIGITPNNDSRLDAEVVVPLKYLSNFCRSLDLHLINCEIELDLSWSRYCVISEILRTSRTVGDLPAQQVATESN